MVSLVALGVFGVVAYRMMSPGQRARAAHTIVSWLARLFWHETPATPRLARRCASARDGRLRRRARLRVNVLFFVWMALAPGPVALPETLVAWGGSFGPRTTNGEWWRLVTARSCTRDSWRWSST